MPTAAKKATPRKKVGGRTKNETAPKGLAKFEQQRKALAYRAAGYTYREIGKALDCDHTWARQLCITALTEERAEDVSELRDAAGHRLDQLRRAAWPAAMNGDIRAITAVLRVEERYARLFGLDAPFSIDVDTTINAADAVLVIDGDTKDTYMAGLKQARPNLRSVQ
jgi:hypothetical protein